jgi:O-succinylbenzoate synthase
MKIETVTLYHVRMPLISAFETSFGRIKTRDCIILAVQSGDFVGWGECVADLDPGYSYETCATAWHILKDYLVPAVLHQDVFSPQDFWPQVSFVRGHPMAKAGLEMALWDIFGKEKGVSLQSLLGGIKKSVEVGVSVGIQESTLKLIETIEEYLLQGYQRVKLKIKPGRDVEDIRVVRETFPKVRLQVDANSAYTLETAQKLLPMDDLNLLLIEQPLEEDDLWDHSHLQKQFRTALCLDESIHGPRHARQALEMGACRIINIKSGRVGGISRAVAIHDLCYARGVAVWCGGMLETGIGRSANLALASLPGFCLPGDISATNRYYLEDITEERFQLNPDSTINVPNLPGLGVAVNKEALQHFTLEKQVI